MGGWNERPVFIGVPSGSRILEGTASSRCVGSSVVRRIDRVKINVVAGIGGDGGLQGDVARAALWRAIGWT
jgi:hypothetical protein